MVKIKTTCSNNKVLVWHYESIKSFDEVIEALKENLPDWQTIEIKIENKS